MEEENRRDIGDDNRYRVGFQIELIKDAIKKIESSNRSKEMIGYARTIKGSAANIIGLLERHNKVGGGKKRRRRKRRTKSKRKQKRHTKSKRKRKRKSHTKRKRKRRSRRH